MSINKFIIGESKTVLDALKKLNKIKDVSRLILFITNNKKEVIGSITDGDIRRALIKNENLNLKLKYICNKEFIYIKKTNSYMNFNNFRKQNIKILPILNKDKSLNSVIDLGITKSNLPLECVIMAGGRGKRLSPLTDKTPKPMLYLGQKPIIEYNIDSLISYGIKKIYISINYLGEQIKSYFGDGKEKGIEIEYISEEKFLGTAGSLSLISNVETNHLLLMNGDLFSNINFEDMYSKLIKENADMIIASKDYKIDIPYAIFQTENNNIKSFKEKPSQIYHSNAGVYILKKELISEIPKNSFYDITDLIEKILAFKKVIHNPITGYWIDIGNPVDYERAKDFVKYL